MSLHVDIWELQRKCANVLYMYESMTVSCLRLKQTPLLPTLHLYSEFMISSEFIFIVLRTIGLRYFHLSKKKYYQ